MGKLGGRFARAILDTRSSEMPIARIIAAGIILVLGNHAEAFGGMEPALEEKVRRSAFVVVATALGATELNAAGEPTLELLHFDHVITGSPEGQTFSLLVDDGGPESDPECCELGRQYLVFAEAGLGMHVRSVAGPKGVYEVRQGMVLDWDGPGNGARYEDVVELIIQALPDRDEDGSEDCNPRPSDSQAGASANDGEQGE